MLPDNELEMAFSLKALMSIASTADVKLYSLVYLNLDFENTYLSRISIDS